jgi:hypothetical protein
VVVVVFLTSAFFSQPTNAIAKLKAMHRAKKRFIIKLLYLARSADARQLAVLLASKKIRYGDRLFPILYNKPQFDRWSTIQGR